MTWTYSVGETIILLTAVGGIAVTTFAGLLTAWRSGRIEKKSERIEQKVDTVHELTNSRLSRIEGELMATKNTLASALAALQQAEGARKTLATEAANVLRDQAVPVPQASGLLTAAGTPVPAKAPADVYVVASPPDPGTGQVPPAQSTADVFVVDKVPGQP